MEMITTDPERRAARLAELQSLLGAGASEADRALLHAFAPLVYEELPDRLALGLPAEVLAARLLDHFQFVAREMPPAGQLYKGLPGIHVSVRNPTGEEAAARGAGRGFPAETTVIATHTPDAPFILESLRNYFRKAGLRVFSGFGLVLTARRQWERIVWIGGPREEGAQEAFCHFEVERIDSRERLRRLEHEIHAVLKCVFTAVEDFESMKRVSRDLGRRLRSRRGQPRDAESAREFLEWLLLDNYIFMGAVRYDLRADGRLERLHESATGVFTDTELVPVVFPGLLEEVESQLVPAPSDHRIIDIDYCHNASALYHIEPIDDIVVREWGEAGQLEAATVILGRFSASAFAQKAGDIPLLREKLEWLLAHSGDIRNSHLYREIRTVFNRFPKRELFYANAAGLDEILNRVVAVTSDEDVVVHGRKGAGYETLYVAFSRLRYSYRASEDLERALADAFGPISFATSTDCGTLVLLVFYFDASRLESPVDVNAARDLVVDLVTTWEDQVVDRLVSVFGEARGRRLMARYTESFRGLYRESTPADEVPEDVARLEVLEGRLEVRVLSGAGPTVALKLYALQPLSLAGAIRTLQNLGLTVTEELRVPLALPEGRKGFLYRFEVEAPSERLVALSLGKERFAKALRALDEEWATDDALNGLVLDAGLEWRDVEVLRTLRNHLLQIRPHYNVETVNGVLLRNVSVAGALFRSFAARFDPAVTTDRAAAVADARSSVLKALEAVGSLSEDEVLRALHNLLEASLRTNFYQRPERPVLSVKVDSRKVEGMPSPRPLFEIYVHSRLLEGIHLRGGKVARGGIRWSDRHDDFRTEVLGLMKTQMVKNSIIVPVGSKGGFVLKGTVPSRPALDTYLVDRYREFISGLLDITDNIVDGQVLHPPEVVRHDGDDPYLVVAADKGTAHLSDTANSVSGQYGFWLGDAFASGGRFGYDHKKVGITARGAWECVKHHFRNLGLDVQIQPFTTAGIGDLAGDVFGNGALQSRAMRLVAAFNHLHIFVDPAPDAERSYAERERLFKLPRSSWRDYDASLISAGGGVFERSAKAVPVSPEMRALLDIPGETASGEEVVRRILTARVDLLYNGGIGTYVKAASEEHAQVGDRANDRLRVDGREVRARVVAEGGNLGFTQRGRLEYAAAGGQLNTDAVDNSGGVDMSDHEVNIKILMDLLVKKGVIHGREERNRILAEMTEEVAALVLADNADQARAITLDVHRSTSRYEEFVALLEDLVHRGVLSRDDDAVPSRAEILAARHAGRGFPRPLLAVMLGQVKRWAYDLLLDGPFPDSPEARPFLMGYFPQRLQQDFGAHVPEHALHREIAATVAANHVVNHVGVSFLHRMMGESGVGIDRVVSAYIAAEAKAGASTLRAAVREAALVAEAETAAWLDLEDALETLTAAALGGTDMDPVPALAALRARLG
jgi:glutamate dehydrogenase